MAAAMTPSLAQPKLGCSTSALRARPQRTAQLRSPSAFRVQAAAGSSALNEMVPDRSKRTTMNWLLVGALGLPGTAMLGPFAYYFVPKSAGSSASGTVAKDALGNDVKASSWLATHKKGDRSLTQGLKSDATYLIVTNSGEIEKYGLNAVCTHLGCVVPWNENLNKFACPCHGSQYNAEGKVVRGPAPLSLALAHTNINDDIVTFTPWTETDFRTGEQPWWK